MRGIAPAGALGRKRRTRTSTALMPNARPRRRGEAPQPRSGAPRAQGLTAATRSAAQSGVPSFAACLRQIAKFHRGTEPGAISTTPRIYTSLTGTTDNRALIRLVRHLGGRIDALWGQAWIYRARVQPPESRNAASPIDATPAYTIAHTAQS